MPQRNQILLLWIWLALGLLVGCGASPATGLPSTSAPLVGSARQILRLATTTSTADSGLLDAILPAFEQVYNAHVEVIAVGTGQALALGTKGDVDVVLVHAREREDDFVAQGYGIHRRDVMYNDFVIVGPPSDPAGVQGATSATAAFTAIAHTHSLFASRGDDSGTYTKEQAIWAAAAITPTKELAWYKALGQGMGETLIAANELGAYTLCDRGTFLATRKKLPGLLILLGGKTINDNKDKALLNPYGLIPVNPARFPGLNNALAEQFAIWITSPATQHAIGTFGKDTFGQSLFYPNAGK